MLEVWSYSINTLPLPISPLLIFFSPPFSFFVSLSFLLCAQTHANTRAHFTSLAHSLPSIFFLCHRRTISSRDQCGTETLINIFSLSVPVVLSNNTMASLGMMLNKSVIYRRCSQDMLSCVMSYLMLPHTMGHIVYHKQKYSCASAPMLDYESCIKCNFYRRTTRFCVFKPAFGQFWPTTSARPYLLPVWEN